MAGCIGLKTGAFLKLVAIASVILSLILLGCYEGYKVRQRPRPRTGARRPRRAPDPAAAPARTRPAQSDYWELGQSLASFHEARADVNLNRWNATYTHNRLVYQNKMAEEKQLLYKILNSTRTDEKITGLVEKINQDIEDNGKLIKDLEQDLFNNGYHNALDGYSPVTSYVGYSTKFNTPLDGLFYVSTATLFFSILGAPPPSPPPHPSVAAPTRRRLTPHTHGPPAGIYGVMCKQSALVQTYLIFNLLHLVLSFALFIDVIGTTPTRGRSQRTRARRATRDDAR